MDSTSSSCSSSSPRGAPAALVAWSATRPVDLRIPGTVPHSAATSQPSTAAPHNAWRIAGAARRELSAGAERLLYLRHIRGASRGTCARWPSRRHPRSSSPMRTTLSTRSLFRRPHEIKRLHVESPDLRYGDFAILLREHDLARRSIRRRRCARSRCPYEEVRGAGATSRSEVVQLPGRLSRSPCGGPMMPRRSRAR